MIFYNEALKSEAELLAAEGYILKTNNEGRLIIYGKDSAGIFHGTRALLQLIPAKTMEDLEPPIPGSPSPPLSNDAPV